MDRASGGLGARVGVRELRQLHSVIVTTGIMSGSTREFAIGAKIDAIRVDTINGS